MYQKPNERLCGQTAIVTGANSGIGAAVAKAIARDGANVVINYVSKPEVAEEIAHEITNDGSCGDAIAIRADVSKEVQVINMFNQTVDKFGTVDICVANAGLQRDYACLLYTSPSPRDRTRSRMPSSA